MDSETQMSSVSSCGGTLLQMGDSKSSSPTRIYLEEAKPEHCAHVLPSAASLLLLHADALPLVCL